MTVSLSQEPESSAAGAWRRNVLTKLAISLGLGAGCAWLLRRGSLSLFPDRQALASADFVLVGVYCVVQSIINVMRGARWQYLLRPLGTLPLWNVIRVALIGYAAQLVLPLRAGEFVRPVLLARDARVSAWAATGTIAAERVVDGLVLSLMLCTALFVSHPQPPSDRIGELPITPALVPPAAYAAAAVFTCAFVCIVAFHKYQVLCRRLIHVTLGRLSARLADYIAGRLEDLSRGLAFFAERRYTLPFLALTALYWIVNAASFELLGRACNLDTLSFPEACVVMGVLGLGIALPSAPGQFGAFQLSVYAGLSLYFSAAKVMGDGGVYVFVLYVTQVVVSLGSGLVALLVPAVRPQANEQI